MTPHTRIEEPLQSQLDWLNDRLALTGSLRAEDIAIIVPVAGDGIMMPRAHVAYKRHEPVFEERPWVVHTVTEEGAGNGDYDLSRLDATRYALERAHIMVAKDVAE